MAYLPPVVVEITGNTDGLVAAVAKAKAALDGLKNSAGDIKIGVDVNAASIAKAAVATDALTAATTRATAGGRRWTGWLATAHNILTVFGANIIADTIGIIAFGVGAVSALAPVIEVINGLGAGYGDLTNYQKAATVQLTNFKNQLTSLANPGIFAVVTGGLALIGHNLGQTGGIMDQATIAFENFVAMLRQAFASGPWQQMFARSQGVIQQDLTALFKLITALINVIPALFHDFNGLGLFVISFATGVLHLIAVIGDANPNLMRFAAVVFLVYRALNMLGQFQAGSMLMRGLGAAFGSFAATGNLAADTLKSLRTYGLGTTAFLLTGFTPAVLTAAGGLGAMVIAMAAVGVMDANYQDSTQRMIASMAQQDKATGNNAAGYSKLAGQLTAYKNQLNDSVHVYALTSGQAAVYRQRLSDVSAAQTQASQTAQTINSNLSYLERTYGLTQQQAYQLAKATGTNLQQAFAKGGGAAQQTRLKIQAYEQTVKAAQNPTSQLGYDLGLAANKALGLTDRVTALTNAFNALLTPFANVIHDTVQWKDGNIALEKAVDKAHGTVNDTGNAVQRYAADQLATAINNTVNLSQATLQQTGSMQKAAGPIRAEIGVLQALGSKSKEVTRLIGYLRDYLNSLHNKNVTLGFHIVTTGSVPSAYQQGANGHAVGYASGTTSATQGWHMVGERGPELMYFKGGEKVVPNAALANVTGYANGTGELTMPPINIYLDGQVIYKSVEGRVYQKNMQNGVRNAHGSAQGRFGVR